MLTFLKFKSASPTSLSKSRSSLSTHKDSPQLTDHASVTKSKPEVLNGTTPHLSDLTEISRAATDSKPSAETRVRSEPSPTSTSMLIAMMELKSDLDWVHAQDSKVKEKISFQRLATTSIGKVTETLTTLSTCTLAHASDRFYYLLYFVQISSSLNL